MNQHSNIFNPAFDEILQHVSKACIDMGIDFYLAGAVARDYHLNKMDNYKPTRRTDDIDIAVMVASEDEFSKLKETLIATGYFSPHKEPIKLIYKKYTELDLLPFGQIEEAGITRLTQPKNFVLGMDGFTLLNEHTEEIYWDSKVNIRVCSLEGIVLLKLIANNEKPQRTKDIADIKAIIKLYFDVFSETVYEEHNDLFGIYDPDELDDYIPKVCAHVIGRKLKTILKKDEKIKTRIINILKEDKGEFWENILMGLMD